MTIDAPPAPAPARRRVGSLIFWIVIAGLAAAVWFTIDYFVGAPGRKAAAEVQAFLSGLESSEVTFFKLDPKSRSEPPDPRPSPRLREWKILEEKPLRDAGEVEDVRSILTRPGTYGTTNFRCFTPGLGFRFKTASRTVEFVICLECLHSYGYDDSGRFEPDRFKTWTLSESGASRLMKVYEKHSATK